MVSCPKTVTLRTKDVHTLGAHTIGVCHVRFAAVMAPEEDGDNGNTIASMLQRRGIDPAKHPYSSWMAGNRNIDVGSCVMIKAGSSKESKQHTGCFGMRIVIAGTRDDVTASGRLRIKIVPTALGRDTVAKSKVIDVAIEEVECDLSVNKPCTFAYACLMPATN